VQDVAASAAILAMIILRRGRGVVVILISKELKMVLGID